MMIADAAPEYRSVLLPKAEPEPAAPAASTPLPNPVKPDVDFSTVMLPRLSPAQLEAAGILPTVHLEPQAAVEPSSVMAADPVASFVDAGAVIEQAEVVDAATVIADQVAIVQPSPVDATNEPACAGCSAAGRRGGRRSAACPGSTSPGSEAKAGGACQTGSGCEAEVRCAAQPCDGSRGRADRRRYRCSAQPSVAGTKPGDRDCRGGPAKRPSPAPAAQEKAPPLQAVAAPAVVPSAPAPSAPVPHPRLWRQQRANPRCRFRPHQ